jgi:hypothetical protein
VEGVQVNLVPQPNPEGLDDAGGVVTAAVEAPVDRLLDAAADGLEGGGHGQGGAGHGQAGVLAEQLAQRQGHRRIAAAQ